MRRVEERVVPRTQRLIPLGLVSLVLLAAIGCSVGGAYRKSQRAMQVENYDEAVLQLSKAVAASPGNSRYTLALERAKLQAGSMHFERGKRYATAQQWELAIAELQQTLLLNPGHQFAADRGVGMGGRIGQHAKGFGLQAIAR